MSIMKSRTEQLHDVIEYANNNPNVESKNVIEFKNLNDLCTMFPPVEDKSGSYITIMNAQRPSRSKYTTSNISRSIITYNTYPITFEKYYPIQLTRDLGVINSIWVEGEIKDSRCKIICNGEKIYDWPLSFFTDEYRVGNKLFINAPFCSFDEPFPIATMFYMDIKLVIENGSGITKLGLDVSDVTVDLKNFHNFSYPIYGVRVKEISSNIINYENILPHVATIIRTEEELDKLDLICKVIIGGGMTCFGQGFGSLISSWKVSNIIPERKYGGYLLSYSNELFKGTVNAINMSNCDCLKLETNISTGTAYYIYANLWNYSQGAIGSIYSDPSYNV